MEFTHMMGGKSDSGTASAPKGDVEWVRHAVFGLVCALVVGMFVWSAKPGFSELKNPDAKDSYYNLLVQGFRAGQLSLKKEAPPELAKLDNPYDPALNKSYIGDVSDMSYYKGKLYLYFGITPALALLWPYATVTGHYLTDREAVVIFFIIGFLAAAGLLRAVWRRYFPELSVWLPAAGVLALGLAAGALDLSLWCDVYEVAVSCGFTFVMLALAAVWCALHEPKRLVFWLLLASVAYGLALGARPSLLFGGIILLIPVVYAWRTETEPGLQRRVSLLLAAFGPVMLIGCSLMLYNALRFDNPFEFGWHYQLGTGYQPTAAQQFSLRYLWFNFQYYFLEPMRWSGHFPFLQTVLPATLPPGYFGVGKSYGGIVLVYFPLVWLALAAPLAWRGRLAAETSRLRWFVAAVFLLFLVCALTVCLFLSASSRYELDFLPALMLLAVIGLWSLERTLMEVAGWRRVVARGGWSVLLAGSVVLNVLVTVEAHAEADYFAGNYFVRQGRADEALPYFQAALAFEPESAAFHTGLGTTYYRKKQLDEAIAQFQKAFEIEPNFAEAAEAHNDLGYSLLQKGQVSEAMTQFQKTLAIQPDFAETHNTLGDCFLQIGKTDEAIAQYQKALEIKPGFVDARNNLGFIFFRLGRVNEAIVQFQKALEIEPDFAGAHYNLGCSLFQAGQVEDAIVQFQKVIALQPGFAQAYNDLGNAFLRKGMAANAVASYRKALEFQPQFISAETSLAWILATWPEPSVRDGREAVALAENANQVSQGKDPLILRTLAAAYAEAGQFSEAVLTAKKAFELATGRSKTGLANALQAEIEGYQKNSPRRSTNDYSGSLSH